MHGQERSKLISERQVNMQLTSVKQSAFSHPQVGGGGGLLGDRRGSDVSRCGRLARDMRVRVYGMKRSAATILVALAVLFGGTTTQVRAGSVANCYGVIHGNFAGDEMGDSVRYGAQVDLPASNSAYFGLCIGTSDAFSSTWVGLGGLNLFDIVQIGLDHCRSTECPYSASQIHVFWAWGRTHGSPGCTGPTQGDIQPTVRDLGVWDGLAHTFKVRKVTSAGVSTYRGYVDGTQVTPSLAASELCWADSHSIPIFYAESGDFGDATGGTDTQRYRMSNAARQDTLGGAFVNTFFQTPCAHVSYNYECNVITTTTLDLWSVHP
jgi:hypothetical protein